MAGRGKESPGLLDPVSYGQALETICRLFSPVFVNLAATGGPAPQAS